MSYQKRKIYKAEASLQVKESDLLASEVLERALNGGIRLDPSITGSGIGIDLIASKSHIIVADADKDYRDDRNDQD